MNRTMKTLLAVVGVGAGAAGLIYSNLDLLSKGAPSRSAAAQSEDATGRDSQDAPQFQLHADQKCNETHDWNGTPNGGGCAVVYRLTMAGGAGPVKLEKINLNDRTECDITNMDVGQPAVRISDEERTKVESDMGDFGKGLVEQITTKAAASVPRLLQLGDSYEFAMPGAVALSANVYKPGNCGSTLAKVTVYTDKGNSAWNLTEGGQ